MIYFAFSIDFFLQMKPIWKCLLPSSSPSTFQKLNRRQLVTCRPIILMTTATTISRCRPKKGLKYKSYIFLLHCHLWCSIFLLIVIQISKSPPEKPLVSIRPSSVGSSVHQVPMKMEDMKTERVMLSSDGGSVESPVEQPFIQRKQKYSSSLCQPADKSR
jgi:hypothetical protein